MNFWPPHAHMCMTDTNKTTSLIYVILSLRRLRQKDCGKLVPGQPGLKSEILSQKAKEK